MANVMIEIPMASYLLCMTRCGIKSPEYLALKNGILVRDAAGNEVVQILCGRERAKMLMERIAELCPESLSSVEQHPFAPVVE